MIQDVLTLYKKAQNGGLNAQEVFWLEGQAATHPCFGMAYMILARHHFRNQSTIKNKSLLKAAAYANNRSLLRHYLEDTLIQPKVRPIPVAEMRPILEKKTAEVISPTVAEASSKPSEPVENKVQNPAQTEDSIVPVAEVEESIVPVAEIEESIVPVAEIEESIVPVAEVEESIVPVAEIEESIVPVADVEDSIIPVAEVEESIVPVAEIEDSIVPVAEIEDSIVPVAEVEESIVPVAEIEDSIVPVAEVEEFDCSGCGGRGFDCSGCGNRGFDCSGCGGRGFDCSGGGGGNICQPDASACQLVPSHANQTACGQVQKSWQSHPKGSLQFCTNPRGKGIRIPSEFNSIARINY